MLCITGEIFLHANVHSQPERTSVWFTSLVCHICRFFRWVLAVETCSRLLCSYRSTNTSLGLDETSLFSFLNTCYSRAHIEYWEEREKAREREREGGRGRLLLTHNYYYYYYIKHTMPTQALGEFLTTSKRCVFLFHPGGPVVDPLWWSEEEFVEKDKLTLGGMRPCSCKLITLTLLTFSHMLTLILNGIMS